jgi:hypothetical protein
MAVGQIQGRAKKIAAIIGAVVLVFLPIEFVAWLLTDFHIDKPLATGGHPTAGRPQHVAPYRLRVVKREFHSKQGKQLNIDEDGFRSGKTSGRLMDEWDPARPNVFMFGGSALFGWLADDDQTIPAHLETLADRKGLNWRVYNFGVTDYSIHDEIQILIDQIREGRIPKMVVFYDGVSEAGKDPRYGIASIDEIIKAPYRTGDYEHQWVEEMSERGLRVSLDNLATVKLAKRLCRRWRYCYTPARPWEAIDEASEAQQTAHAQDAARVYVQYAKMVNALGRAFGFKTLYVLQPVGGACVENAATYPFTYLRPPRRWQYTYTPKLYANIINMAPSDMRVANLCNSLNPKIASGMQPFSTPLHLNAEGNAYMASLIFDLLRETGRAAHSGKSPAGKGGS